MLSPRHNFLRIGKVVAVLLHPCFLFFYIVLWQLFQIPVHEWNGLVWQILGIAFGLTVLLPALFPILYAGDAFLRDRSKRPLTLLVTFLCYAGCFVWLFLMAKNIFHRGWTIYPPLSAINTPQPAGFNVRNFEQYQNDPAIFGLIIYDLRLLAILCIGLLLSFITSFKFKISLHGNGVGFLSALIILKSIAPGFLSSASAMPHLLIYLFILCLCGILLWQRIASGSHAKKEVFWGFVSGFAVTFIFMGKAFDFATSILPGWHTTFGGLWQ